MSSLRTHLREAGEHGALAFHPGCPICREQRLLGSLCDWPLVPSTAPAALAAGLLAVFPLASLPAPVLAGEPPSEREGEIAPEDPGNPGESFHSPDWDPGGGNTELPLSVGPEEPDGEEGSVPLESEPPSDPGVPATDPTDLGLAPEAPEDRGVLDSPTTGVEEPPVPPADPPPSPVVETPPVPDAPASPAVPDAPAPPVEEPERGEDPSAPAAKRQPGHESSDRSTHPRGGTTPPAPRALAVDEEPPVATAPEIVSVETQGEPTTETTTARDSPRAKLGAAVHVVQPGESLWSIASDVLSPGASIAGVAREVSRLWELNRERIGTGDPDLILPGTRLSLR